MYQNEEAELTVSATEGYELKSITITYNQRKSGVLLYNSAEVASASAVSVSGNSVKFSVGNSGTETKGQVRITEVSVIYDKK